MWWPRRSQGSSSGWTAVIFSPKRVEIAAVGRRTGEKPKVGAWESFAADNGEIDALKRLRKTLGGRCTTLLRHGQYQLLQVEAPQVPAEEKKQALRWRVKEMLDFPVDRGGVEAIDIPAGQGGRTPQVFVVAASHAVLQPTVRLFQDAQVELAAIDIPELAQRNIAALFEDENRGLALLAFDASGGRLTFTYGGELYASRHMDIAAKDIAAAADNASSNIYERVLLEVQRSLDNFDRNYSHISLNRLLVAPGPGMAGFVDYLRENLHLPVAVLDLSQALDLAAVPALAEPDRQGEALLAIGTALREERAQQ